MNDVTVVKGPYISRNGLENTSSELAEFRLLGTQSRRQSGAATYRGYCTSLICKNKALKFSQQLKRHSVTIHNVNGDTSRSGNDLMNDDIPR